MISSLLCDKMQDVLLADKNYCINLYFLSWPACLCLFTQYQIIDELHMHTTAGIT